MFEIPFGNYLDTELLTPQDLEIQKRIADRVTYRNRERVKKPTINIDIKSDGLRSPFRQFREFFNVIEWDLFRDLFYHRDRGTKVCLRCGHEMAIGCELPFHYREHCRGRSS